VIGLDIGLVGASMLGGEGDLVTPEQLDTLLARISQQSWHMASLTGLRVVRNGNTDWSLTPTNTGGNCGLYPPGFEVCNAGGPGPNRSWQVFLDDNYDESMSAMDLWYRLRYRFAAGRSRWSANPTAGMCSGIQIGTPSESGSVNPPWPASPLTPYARLGIKHDTGKFYLEASTGDIDGSLFSVEVGDDVALPDDERSASFFELVWDPYAPQLIARINHVPVYTLNDPDLLPKFGVINGVGGYLSAGGLYAETGSVAGAIVSAEFFYPSRTIIHPATRGGGAAFWYEAS
jgi:hypothetical protein